MYFTYIYWKMYDMRLKKSKFNILAELDDQ